MACPAWQCDNLLASPQAMSMALPDCLVLNTSNPAWQEVQQADPDISYERNLSVDLVSCDKHTAPESRDTEVESMGTGAYSLFRMYHQSLLHQEGSICSRPD